MTRSVMIYFLLNEISKNFLLFFDPIFSPDTALLKYLSARSDLDQLKPVFDALSQKNISWSKFQIWFLEATKLNDQ